MALPFIKSVYSIPPLLSALVFISLGGLVFFKNRKSAVNRIFALFCLSTFWWQFSWFILFNFPWTDPANDAFASVMVRVGYTGINFIGITMLHFVVLLLDYKKHLKYVYANYVLSFLLLILLWTTDWYIDGFFRYFFGYYPRANFLHLAHLFQQLLLGGIYGYALIWFARKKFRDNPFRYNQLKYIFIAFVIYFPAASDYLVNWNIEFYPFGFILITITASIVAFTIIRYRFLEIETVIHRTFLWALTLILFILPLGVLYMLFYRQIFRLNHAAVIGLVSLTLLLFLNYYRFFKPRIDHLFRRRKEDYYKVLSEAPSRIGGSLDLAVFSERLFRELKNVLYTRNGLMIIRTADQKAFNELYSAGYEELKKQGYSKPDLISLPVEDTVIRQLLKSPKAMERQEIEINPEFESVRDRFQDFFRTSSLECLIPLLMGSELVGIMGLGKKENLSAYTIRDLEILSNIGRQIGIAVDNALHHKDIVEKERIEEELRLGKQIQTSLLPQSAPHISHLEIDGLSQPAKEIGGDYFDFISLDQNTRLGIVIGDVSGKGVAAGLLMAMVKTAIHILSPDERPREILMKVNAILDRHIGGEKFMTMLYLIWQSQNSSITYSSAGHEHIMIFRRATGTIEVIQSGGIILGIVPDIREFLEENSIRMEKGDKMLLYTDGVTEAHDAVKNRFGMTRLQETFRKYSGRPSSEIMKAVKDEVYSFIGSVPQYDDITLIVLEAV